MNRQDRAIAHAIKTLNEGVNALRQVVRARRMNEDASGQPMTIIVHNSGYGTSKKPVTVYNTQLVMDQGRPILKFAFQEGTPAEYTADFTQEGWVADMN